MSLIADTHEPLTLTDPIIVNRKNWIASFEWDIYETSRTIDFSALCTNERIYDDYMGSEYHYEYRRADDIEDEELQEFIKLHHAESVEEPE